jgi:hypothetical protein
MNAADILTRDVVTPRPADLVADARSARRAIGCSRRSVVPTSWTRVSA